MKAQVITSYGGPEVFETRDVPVPQVKPGHVLIRVAASSVNPVDTKIRSGMPAFKPDLPAILHGDVAGVVEAVGEGVTIFKPGDEVYACAGGVKGRDGALAEYMLADADLVALKPASLSLAEAAALPLVTITAWEALIDRARIQPGDKVLIHAATGGVGHVAIQIAKAAGAIVHATASTPEKQAIAKELGADHVIDYRNTSVADYVGQYTGGAGFDVVFDTVGGENIDRSFEAVRPLGQVSLIAARSSHDLSPLHSKGISVHVVLMLLPMLLGRGLAHHGDILRRAADMVERGRLRPLIDKRRFSFEQVGEAPCPAGVGQGHRQDRAGAVKDCRRSGLRQDRGRGGGFAPCSLMRIVIACP